MSIGEEMTMQDVLNTKATFHNVRPGGPKDKRLRRVELMGENTPKPLHWMKVEQQSFETVVSEEDVKTKMQQLADVGDIYRPIDCDTKEPLDFLLVGYFAQGNLLQAYRAYNNMVLEGIKFNVTICKPWLIGLYPKGGVIPIGGSS
jgi:hypothetical protein